MRLRQNGRKIDNFSTSSQSSAAQLSLALCNAHKVHGQAGHARGSELWVRQEEEKLKSCDPSRLYERPSLALTSLSMAPKAAHFLHRQ